jgi:hypothetical protein
LVSMLGVKPGISLATSVHVRSLQAELLEFLGYRQISGPLADLGGDALDCPPARFWRATRASGRRATRRGDPSAASVFPPIVTSCVGCDAGIGAPPG